MPTHIALLRAVNIGGQSIAMADLRAFAAAIGLLDAKTLLQSGNLVFRDDGRTSAELESLLETQAEKRLGLRTDFMVRSAGEWRAVIARNPFSEEAERDPGHLVVLACKHALQPEPVAALQAAIKGPEIVRLPQAGSRELYITYPDGIGRSRLTNAVIEKKLGTSGTGRNWNTVLKLGALASI